MTTTTRKAKTQLGDLNPGERFRDAEGHLWLVTDWSSEDMGTTLCVKPYSGETEWLCNSTRTGIVCSGDAA
jgi:hypothetical protein